MTVPGDSRGGGRGRQPPSRRPAGQRFLLDIVAEGGDWALLEPLGPAVEAAAAALGQQRQIGKRRGAATIVLASDADVRALNASWRGKDKPTNVLSFPAAQRPGNAARPSRAFLGDIVLAAETLAREAAEQGIPPRHHLQHLVIHGLLHLLGYDHETDDDAEIMEALEVAALAHLGVPSPYDDRELILVR